MLFFNSIKNFFKDKIALKIRKDPKDKIIQEKENIQKMENIFLLFNLSYNQRNNNFGEYLELWLKIFTIISPIALLTGGVILYIHLSKLGIQSLFPNLITNPTIFIGITIATALIIIFLLWMPFYFPYILADSIIKREGSLIDFSIKIILSLLIPAIMICIFHNPFSISKDWVASINLTLYFLSSALMPTLLIRKGKLVDIILEDAPLYLCAIFSLLIFYILEILIYSRINSFFFILFSFFLLVINIFSSWLSSTKKSDNNKIFILIIPIISATILGFTKISYPETQIASIIFNNLGYTEDINQGRWYLIDKRFIDWNIQNHENFEKLRERFNYKFENYPEMIPTNVLRPYYSYQNSIYGYLAWNLGDNKIICPNNIKINLSQPLSDISRCLVIKQDYLQPLPNGL